MDGTRITYGEFTRSQWRSCDVNNESEFCNAEEDLREAKLWARCDRFRFAQPSCSASLNLRPSPNSSSPIQYRRELIGLSEPIFCLSHSFRRRTGTARRNVTSMPAS